MLAVEVEARRRARRFRVLACAVLLALTIPRMTQRGMFIDGIVWSSVSRNLSLGIGRLWAPSYTATIYDTIYEHPPLGFGLESLAFRALGDHPAVERIYSLLMFAACAALIAAIWRRFLPKAYDWLPLLFWVMPSIVTWAVINNMLENTQAVFTCGAVYALCLACGPATRARTVACGAVAGAAIVAGALVKGPVAFSPIVVPALFWLAPKGERPQHAAVLVVSLGAALAAASVALFLWTDARRGIGEYLDVQLLASLGGQRDRNTTAFGVLYRLSTGIIARMGAVVAALYLVRRRGGTPPSVPRIAWVFLGAALAASVPMVVSPRLSDHYFVPSVSLYALAAGAFALPFVRSFGDAPSPSWKRRLPMLMAAVLAIATVGVPIVHGAIEPRGQDLLRDIDALDGALPPGAIVGACRASELEWGLRGYLQRFMRVSFDASGAPVNGWFLVYRSGCDAPATCSRAGGDPDLVVYRCAPRSARGQR